MTNELAIRILIGDVLGTSEQTHEAIKMAVKALSLPSAPRWIPVTERLPEEDTDVLVTGENGEIDIARWNYDSWTEDDVVVWEGSGYPYIDPVAWMPLPEPWKGGE